MAMFMTAEWLKTLVDITNSDPNYAKSAKNWEGAWLLVVWPEGPIKEPLYAYLDAWHGHIREAYMVQDPATIQNAIIFGATLSVWRRMYSKQLHPVAAVARRMITLQGNMVKLMQNAKMGQAVMECLSI
jgi:putative sterol carrier protein